MTRLSSAIRIDPHGDDFWDLYAGVQQRLFRYEGLQTYDLKREGHLVEAYLAGDHSLVPPGRWEELIDQHTAAGRTVERVRLVEEPWTDYTRWELHGYRTNEAAGEQIRILPLSSPSSPSIIGDDFLVIDDDVWSMQYDVGGVLVALIQVGGEAADRYYSRRESALSASVSLRQYLADARMRLRT